jgi:ATP-binding cassette subfamily B protein
MGFFVVIYGLITATHSFYLHEITLGMLVFILSSLLQLSLVLSSVLMQTSAIYDRLFRLDDLMDIIDYKSTYTDGNNILKLSSPPTISLQNVDFSYANGSRIFDDLTLVISPGEKIAIVGENGAGKTTLVKLLLRLYDPQTGHIMINDTDIKDITINSWYDAVGVLLQEFNTYPQFTVKENVQTGDITRPLTETALKRALEQAEAYDFVAKYPKSTEQILSEKYRQGIKPSTGQWQRLAIARFMYRESEVVIFDEPTASIDAVAESKIFDNIFKRFADKTVIIISHRFSTVRNADRIVVLDKGKIVEDGTHKELIQLNGKYAYSFNLQAKGYTA